MGKLSDNKLAKLKALEPQGGFWYITKQNLNFRDLCFMAKILESWGDRKEESYQSFFDSHKEMKEFGSFPPLTAHRATKNCEYIGLIRPSNNYKAENLTPFYFALKDICDGDFNRLSSFPEIIDKQLERMFIDSNTSTVYNVKFQICPFMFLFKVLLLIGDITKSYKLSKSEFKLFVATAQSWMEYFEVVESILRYREDSAYRAQCDINAARVSDVRYNILAENHSQITVEGSEISIPESEIRNVRRKVAEYELSESIQSAEDIFNTDIINKSSLPLQQIFYGAPGTGKSHKVKEVTDSIAKEFVFRTTFHPDSDYSTFVGAYKPTMKQLPIFNQQTGAQIGVEDKIVYSFVPQAFLKAYVAAWQNPEQSVFLVIEEINRGNCAQIFGDIFQLLDRKDGVSEYPIKADQDIRDYLAKEFAGYDLDANILSGEELVLPANLHIWATMNTSDQSLFPIDSAFKRRWDWKYMPIHDPGENWTIALSNVEYDWWDFVEKINNVIGNMTSSEDKKLGYFFCKACNGKIDAEKFVNKVIFYLWNDVFKDYELSDKAFQDGEGKLTFNKFYTPSGDANEAPIKTLMENLGVSTSDLISEIDEEAVNLSKDDLSALQQKRLDFWTRYLKYAQNNADYMQYFGGRQTPTKNHYYKYQVFPNTNGSLCVVIKHKANKLFVKFETTDEQLYNGLYLHKDAIQSELGDINLTWEGKVGTRARIDIYAEHDVDFNNEQSIFNLIIDRLLRMREVFDKYLNN